MTHATPSIAITPSNVGAFARSDLFTRLFDEGMALVDETARYLDGDGREDARALDRGPALAYATLSMRLTTKLMQIASWLLVLRALREGKMSEDEAAASKHRLQRTRADVIDTACLPARLADLNARATATYDRLLRIDYALAAQQEDAAPSNGDGPNGDASARIDALRKAFGESA
ncbi:MAG: DUF1465 family protein [Pseudomonadota bacterium]